MKIIKIYGAYHWKNKSSEVDIKSKIDKNRDSYLYIEQLIDSIKLRVNKELEKCGLKEKCKIHYTRLRSTSGSFVLDSIRERMSNAYAIIFDISEFNNNVMLELGMCLEMQKHIKNPAKVFLIAKADSFSHSLLPSDLAGYYLTCYKKNNKNKYSSDSLSLEMRMTSDIIEKYKLEYFEDDFI